MINDGNRDNESIAISFCFMYNSTRIVCINKEDNLMDKNDSEFRERQEIIAEIQSLYQDIFEWKRMI